MNLSIRKRLASYLFLNLIFLSFYNLKLTKNKVMISLSSALQKLCLNQTIPKLLTLVRHGSVKVRKPEIGRGKSYRRIVHYPEQYTVKPLEVTNLGGRDPNTGRLAVKGIGGGIKHKYHWIAWKRVGPSEGPPQEERVIQIIKDGCRTAYVALVAHGNHLKYILATENMKPGDIIKTSCHIPRIPGKLNFTFYILNS